MYLKLFEISIHGFMLIIIASVNIFIIGPYKCHFDNPDHIDIICRKSCTRLHPECKHPCNKSCGDKCGL